MLIENFRPRGLTVVGTQIVPLDATDYSSFLTALKAKHPDVIWDELAAAVNSEPSMLGQNGPLHAATVVFNNSGSCQASYPRTPGITYMAETNAGAITAGPRETVATKDYEATYYGLGGIANPDPNISGGLYTYDFFPLVRAVCAPEFNLNGIATTTGPSTPFAVVSGPAAARAGVNHGRGALGPGWRANASIGRALRLLIGNIGRARRGIQVDHGPARPLHDVRGRE